MFVGEVLCMSEKERQFGERDWKLESLEVLALGYNVQSGRISIRHVT